MKPVPIIKRDGFLHYTDTLVKVVTTKAEVQCEIINLPSVPTCSTPLCSPVKSVGDRSDDDQKDLDYIPKTLFLLDDLLVEEVEGEEKTMMIRKTWTIFQKLYFSLTTCW